MRMIQRKIRQDSVIKLFERFLEFCRIHDEVITTGAYSISGRTKENKKAITLRIDIDKISDKSSEAHTGTVFVGYGNTENTISLSLEH